MTTLKEIYLKEAMKSISQIKKALSELEKDIHHKKAIDDLALHSHKLDGNSLQAGRFLVAYLANKMNNLMKQIKQGEIELTPERLAFLSDFLQSLERTIKSEQGPKSQINKLLKRLDQLKQE